MEQNLYEQLFESAKQTEQEITEITKACDELMQIDVFGEIIGPDPEPETVEKELTTT